MADRPWPDNYRVALLSYSLIDQETPEDTRKLHMMAYGDQVAEAAVKLGWDRTCRRNFFVHPVPREFLLEVAHRSGWPREARPIQGLNIANADASNAELEAAAHLFCTEGLLLQEQRFDLKAGRAFLVPPGEKPSVYFPGLKRELLDRKVIFSFANDPIASAFVTALRAVVGQQLDTALAHATKAQN